MPQNNNKRYKKEEIEFILQNYETMSVEEIAKKLKRTPKAIRGKINLMGINLKDLERNKYHWTEEEIKWLKENYKLYDREIQQYLSNKSLAAIQKKRTELGLRKLTGDEYIDSNYKAKYRNGKTVWIHREVVENKIGRPLRKEERVHHIDGNKINNKEENLFLCKNIKHHANIHSQLEKISFELVKRGIIKFNHELGEYYINENKLPTRTEG